MINANGEMIIVWSPVDVKARCSETGNGKMSQREAERVLFLCDHHHDCNIGMTWDVMDFWIDTVIQERTKK